MKKVPGKYTDEELLKALDQAPVSTPVQGITDVLGFLSFYNIKPGKQKVAKKEVYNLYCKWSKNRMTSKLFAMEMNLHFPGGDYYYLINLSSIAVSNQLFLYTQKRSKDRTKSPKSKQHFECFLNAHDIKEGSYYIEAFVLYSLYDKWWYDKKHEKPLFSSNLFNRFMRLNFKEKRTKNQLRWFAVNQSILNHFTEESLSWIRKGYYEKRTKICKDKEKRKEQKET